MKASHVVLICLLVLSLSLVIDAKKKKKSGSTERVDKRPTSVEALLYCNSCQAIVRETLKKIKDSRKEYDVSDALSDICAYRNFSIYEFPPPDMKKGCEAFLSGWNEELETALIERKSNETIEDEICRDITSACQGVEKGARKGNDDYVTINGKKVKMGDDGKVDIDMQAGPKSDEDL